MKHMSSEQLIQSGYIDPILGLKGKVFGKFEELSLGATTVAQLASAGSKVEIPNSVHFDFKVYTTPKSPKNCKPDVIFLLRKSKKDKRLQRSRLLSLSRPKSLRVRMRWLILESRAFIPQPLSAPRLLL